MLMMLAPAFLRLLALVLPGLCLLVPSSRTSWHAADGALVIRKGGVYTGKFQSTSSDIPCIRVATPERVVLRGCQITGPGVLIDATAGNANLVVENCVARGTTPTSDQKARGRFLSARDARSLRIENCDLISTGGISILHWSGNGSPEQTLKVLRNRVRNIDGRYRDGGGTTLNFLGLDKVRDIGNVEIAWNEVINEPNRSLVEDVINFYNSSGTPKSPIRVHDNYLQGAYPYPAHSPKFSGSGLITDGNGASELTAAGHVEAYHNQFVSICNSGMAVAAGHHIRYHHNRIVTAALLPDDTTRLPSCYTGLVVFNAYNQPSFGKISVDSNTVGYVKWGYNRPYPNRNDEGDYGLPIVTNTLHLPNPITRKTEAAEWRRWQQKLSQGRVKVGSHHAVPVADRR
jgi:hypothetical protein